MKKLVIVMTSDKNYVAPTKVAIYSMVQSTKDVFFDIHILCNDRLDAESRTEFDSLAKQLQRVKIVYEVIDDSQIAEAKTLGGISIASYYRLYISRFVKESKCLFIDGDVVINSDLKEIYDADLTGYYMAGVRDCGVQARMRDGWEWIPKIDVPDLKEYINAGFILFNLDKIREDNLEEEFIGAIQDGYRYMDQDILNKFCYGKIKNLPLRYNLFSEYYDRIDEMGVTDYTEEELVGVENWAMIHYPGVFKPWYCRRLKANQLWWSVAKKVLNSSELDKYVRSAEEYERVGDWTTIWEKIKYEKEIVIFGYSEGGRKLQELLENYPNRFEIAFADNDERKHGYTVDGKEILAARRAVEWHKKAYWIISSQLSHVVIKKQLIELGVDEDRIIRYIYKNDAYYEGLDEMSYKYEMEILRNY